METYIFILLSTFVLFVLLYIYINVSSQKSKCTSIKEREIGAVSYTDLSSTTLKYMTFKSAFNCCCIGGMKNDYVDICALKNCSREGVRVLDFQIFSLNNHPIISASTVNENEYKELYNYLSFSEVITHINKEFLFPDSEKPQNKHPLFLNFRIQSNNIDIYNEMASTILNTISGNSKTILSRTPINKSLHQYTLDDLAHHVIIMVDLTQSPKMKNSFIKTQLNNITLVTFGNGFKYHSIHEDEAYLQSGVELSSIYPSLSAYSNNYDYDVKGILNQFNFIYMNFHKNDAYLKKYNKYFISESSIISFKDQYTGISFDFI